MSKFFAMSHEEQLAELDKRIAEMQLREAARNAANALGAGGSNGPPGPWGGGSDAQQIQRRQSMLADIPPEQRSQFMLYRQMLTARMQQQGVTASGGFF
jgi:hypothetical protein